MDAKNNFRIYRNSVINDNVDIEYFNAVIAEDIRVRKIRKLYFERVGGIFNVQYEWEPDWNYDYMHYEADEEKLDKRCIIEESYCLYEYEGAIQDLNNLIANRFDEGRILIMIHYGVNGVVTLKWYNPNAKKELDERDAAMKELKEETEKKITRKRRQKVTDNTPHDITIIVQRFNPKAFVFGEAYFIKPKDFIVARKLLRYNKHEGVKINDWVGENVDLACKSVVNGVYALLKDVTYQGTLITFFVGCKKYTSNDSLSYDGTCIEWSIPIDAVDDIIIKKVELKDEDQ